MRSLFGPFVELIKSWNLPGWLVHWGHPGNMVYEFPSVSLTLILQNINHKLLQISPTSFGFRVTSSNCLPFDP